MKTAAHHLNTLRAKPDHVKRRIAFFASFGITFLIFVFWIVSLSVGSPAASANTDSIDSVASNTPSPISSLSASAGDAWNNFMSFFSGSKAPEKSSGLEVLPAGK